MPGTDAERLSFKPDMLSEAMVATASGYFLSPIGDLGAENEEQFRETIHNFYQDYTPETARLIFAGGLLAAGFKIELEPLKITPPDLAPAEAVDSSVFLLSNWRHVAPTIIDMGLRATTQTVMGYNYTAAPEVLRQPLAPEAAA